MAEDAAGPQTSTTLWDKTVFASTKVLACLDYVGEQLAWFFGLTESRYQYYVDEALRQEEENLEAEVLAQQEENARVMQMEASRTQKLEHQDADLEMSAVPLQEENTV